MNLDKNTNLANNPNGLFIVIEGADGSGKGTQFKLLSDRLRREGHAVEVFDFPRYEEHSSHFVRAYLNGEYGPASSINPYTASLFYALDRYAAAPKIRNALNENKIVLSNRYVGSNMAHQGAKFEEEAQQRGFFLWEEGLEYQLLSIPRPTINIYLRVPAEISYELISKKAKRGYTEKSHDEHEADLTHLQNAVKTYDTLSELFPKDFTAIECVDDGKLLEIDEISKLIWEKLKPMLPSSLGAKSKKKTQPLAKSNADPNLAGHKKLSSATTTTIQLKDVSLLAAAAIEANLPETTRVYDDWNDYDYHLPENISDDTATVYTDSLEKLKKNYNILLSKLKEYIKNNHLNNQVIAKSLLPIVPLAAYCKVKLSGSEDELRHLVSNLGSYSLPEIRLQADKIEKIALSQNLKLSGDIKSAPQAEPELVGNTITKVFNDRLTDHLNASNDEYRLTRASTRNELELINGTLSNNYDDTPTGLDSLSYEQKKKKLETQLSNNSSNFLKGVSYHFDATIDRVSIDRLRAAKFINVLSVQAQTTRYGYKTPKIIEDSGIEDLYRSCFEQSLALFSHLQASGREEYGGYATLMGHKIKCQFVIHAHKLGEIPTGDEDINKILNKLLEKVSEIHPLIADFFRANQKAKAKASTTKKRHLKRSKNVKRTHRP